MTLESDVPIFATPKYAPISWSVGINTKKFSHHWFFSTWRISIFWRISCSRWHFIIGRITLLSGDKLDFIIVIGAFMCEQLTWHGKQVSFGRNDDRLVVSIRPQHRTIWQCHQIYCWYLEGWFGENSNNCWFRAFSSEISLLHCGDAKCCNQNYSLTTCRPWWHRKGLADRFSWAWYKALTVVLVRLTLVVNTRWCCCKLALQQRRKHCNNFPNVEFNSISLT